jgi:mRNA-degrading endonuclease RelE of RelBE toxin-antitoxin system
VRPYICVFVCMCYSKCVFEVFVTVGAEGDLRLLPAGGRRVVLDAIERQLPFQPDVPTANRKPLRALCAPWAQMEPVWELRVGDFRVFYDVDPGAGRVYVRAVRRKPPHRTTEECL